MKKFLIVVSFLACSLGWFSGQANSQYKALFDNTKNETAGNADWIIDTDQPVPSPAQSGITSSTSENYWLGAISAWGVTLAKRGWTVATLTTSYGISYGNSSNAYDLSKYDVFIVCEPQSQFTAAEKAAIKNFVQNGGGLMMVGDHNGSDRNSDGWDSPEVWNDLRSDSLFGIHFQSASESNNSFSQVATNVATGGDPLITGVGLSSPVTALSYHSGTSMTLLPAVNATAAGHIWMNGATHGSTQVMFATAKYGSGRVAGVGDSSPADDGSAQSGNSSIYDGWGEAGATDSTVFINACLWLAQHDASVTRYAITASAGTNGTVSPSGSVAVDSAASQSFTFTPSTGYHVDSVVIDGVKLGTSPSSYTFSNVTAAHTVRVSFAVNTYIITSSSGSNGSISPAGSTNVNYGGSQLFSFTPAPGYHVDSVIIDGIKQGSSPGSYTFTNVTAAHAIRVSFAVNTYTITATAGSNGTITPSGVIAVSYGQNQAFTVTPTSPSAIQDVVVDGNSIGAVTAYTFTTVTANHSIAATFSNGSFPIVASAGTGGVISPSGTVFAAPGATANFTVTADAGHSIDSLLVDGAPVGAAAGLSDFTYAFTAIDAAHTIRAVFAVNAFSLTVNASGGTVGRFPELATYPYGTMVTLTPSPSTGYEFLDWSGDVAQEHAGDNPLTVRIDSAMTINAVFATRAFPLTIHSSHGSVTRNPNQAGYDSGAVVSIAATPDSGYEFTGWTGDISTNANPLMVFMTAPKTLTAHFLGDSATLTGSAGSNGLITPSGAVRIATMQSKRFVFTPFPGYGVDSVIVDGINVPDSTAGFTFASVTEDHSLSVTFVQRPFGLETHLNKGWNIVSLPLLVADNRLSVILPPAISHAYKFNGGYVQSDSLLSGTGYWMKSGAVVDTTLEGLPVIAETVQVAEGWNLLGSIATPLAASGVVSDPPGIIASQFFGYEAGYSASAIVVPGRGYWVKCSAAGKLIFLWK